MHALSWHRTYTWSKSGGFGGVAGSVPRSINMNISQASESFVERLFSKRVGQHFHGWHKNASLQSFSSLWITFYSYFRFQRHFWKCSKWNLCSKASSWNFHVNRNLSFSFLSTGGPAQLVVSSLIYPLLKISSVLSLLKTTIGSDGSVFFIYFIYFIYVTSVQQTLHCK